MTAPEPTVEHLPGRDLNAAQVSYRTGISVETLRSWRNSNRGPYCYKIDRRWFYPEIRLVAWQQAHQTGPAAQTAGTPHPSSK